MSTQTTATLERPPAPEPTGRSWRGNPKVVLPVILVAQLMVVLDMSIVNVALPHIQRSLDFSPAGLSWVLNTYTLAFGGLMLLGARAGDLLGRRRVFLGGVALFTAASLLGGFATSAGWLLAARTAQGIGGAFAAPATLAMLTSMFPQGRERTRALGLYSAVSVGGAAIGLVAGGMLTQWVSWRWVMFVNVPIGIVLLAAASLAVVESPRVRGRFDLTGAISSTVGMTALVYGFVHAASSSWGSPATLGAFAVGVVLVSTFLMVERRAEQPITPLSLFADRIRSGSYVARLLMFAGMTGTLFFLTQFLQDVLHYSPIETGMAFLPVTVMLFAASQASARVLVERYGDQRVIVTGVALSTLSFLWLTQLSAGSSYLDVLGPLVLLGLGNGAAIVPLTSTGLHNVEPRLAGAASGLLNVSQQVGASLGLSVLVTVFGAARRGAGSEPTGNVSPAEHAQHLFVTGADAAFLMGAVLLAATFVVVSLTLRKTPTPESA
ncbi:MAG: MFS transporter [Nocardioidaceae bacterium]